MKKLYFFLFALLSITLAQAQTFNYNGINYTVTSATTVEVGNNFDFVGIANIPTTVSDGTTNYTVTSIGDSAFANSAQLTSIIIPNTVTSIGNQAFVNCFGLTSATIIGNSLTSIGQFSFGGCSSLTSINIPNSVASIGDSAFENCSGLTSVTIPNSLAAIGKRVFENCTGLTSVTIPNSVTSIDDYAFTSCSGLTSVTIPNSVTTIGHSAFSYTGLTSVTIPNSVTSMGDAVFLSCLSLSAITLPNSITSIGMQTFLFCTSLTSINIPNSVTSIGGNAFGSCFSLTSVTVNWITPLAIGPSVFNGVNQAACNLIVPVDTAITYDSTPVWTDFNISAPSNIILSNASIDENVVANSTVGVFSSIDNDGSSAYIYSLVSGTGDFDNTYFNIDGSDLRITAIPDFETQNSYSIRVRTTDQGGLWYEKVFTVTINNINETPTGLSLSALSLNENVVANTIVGTLTSTDPDAGNSHTYTLVSGAGSTNNAAFNISSNSLRITNSPDFETQNSYSIRVRTTDQGGLSYDEAFTITINDLQEAPRGCWAQVSAGGYHTLAIAQDGTLWSWGDNANGQLGVGPVGADKLNPTQVSTQGNWASISAGEFYSLAVKTDGTLWGWGNNQYGQLGNNTTTQQNTPVQIGADSNWSKIIAGYNHSMAIKTDGTLWAWGRNNYGQVGNNTIVQQNTPVQLGSDTDWATIKLGKSHSVALKTNGNLWAWGRNTFNQLGNGNTTQLNVPTQIGTDTWSSIQAGDSHNIALKANGTLWAWGDNFAGMLGTGDTAERSTPTQIGTDNNWSSIATGSYHSYATKSTGALYAWGDNYFGQLGLGNFTEQHSPVQVGTNTDYYSIIAGNYFGITQLSEGNFMSLGDNQGGQLGNGATTPNTTGQNTPGNMGCSANVLAFDGDDDILTITSSGTSVTGDNSLNKSYSVEMKVKFKVVPVYHYMFGKEDATSGFSLSMRYNRLNFYQAYDAGRRSGIEYPISIVPNTWYSIVATFDYPSKTQKLYVNGVLVGSITDTGTPSFSNAETYLGFEPNSGGAFYGEMSDFRIWDEVRTAQDAANYRSSQQQNVTTDVNLLAHYKFNQGIANGNNAGLTTLYNEVVGGPVGTLQNFALIGSTSNWSFDANALETLNTNDFSMSDIIKVYPNPSTGIYTIDLNEDAQVEVYDMLGKVVYKREAQEGKSTIDISNYQAGIYLLHVKSENGSVTKKIIKQ